MSEKSVGIVVLFLVCTSPIWARPLEATHTVDNPGYQCRVEKLVDMLLANKSPETRIEAAYSLKNFSSPSVQEALLTALLDPEESVRIAALSSLAVVGDKSILPTLRAMADENEVVKEQLRRTIVLLEERFPESRLPVEWQTVRGVVEIRGLRDGTGNDYSVLLNKFLTRHLRLQTNFVVAEPPAGLDRLTQVFKHCHAKPLMVTGVLHELSKRKYRGGMFWDAAVSITVLDFPGKSIRALLTNTVSVGRASRHYRRHQDRLMEERAMEEVMRAVASDISRRLDEL